MAQVINEKFVCKSLLHMIFHKYSTQVCYLSSNFKTTKNDINSPGINFG